MYCFVYAGFPPLSWYRTFLYHSPYPFLFLVFFPIFLRYSVGFMFALDITESLASWSLFQTFSSPLNVPFYQVCIYFFRNGLNWLSFVPSPPLHLQYPSCSLIYLFVFCWFNLFLHPSPSLHPYLHLLVLSISLIIHLRFSQPFSRLISPLFSSLLPCLYALSSFLLIFINSVLYPSSFSHPSSLSFF